MSTKKLALTMTLALALAAVASTAHAALYWTPWVSEENGGPNSYCTSWSEGARGFGCRGRYCDDVHMLCDTLPNGIWLDPATDSWSHWVSEEWDYVTTTYSFGWYPHDQTNYAVCKPTFTGGILNGIRCSGSNCDNMTLECAVPRRPDGSYVTPYNCSWSAPISEEAPNNYADFGPNRFITGLMCSGRYCDNLSFLVCTIW